MGTRLRLVIEVDDPRDEDRHHSTGLTTEAYDRLYGAVSDAGFGFVEGPDRLTQDKDAS